MLKDLSATPLYQEVAAVCHDMLRPGEGLLCDATDIHARNTQVVFAATVFGPMQGSPPTRIAHLELNTCNIRLLTSGPGTDRAPKLSPDGQTIAYLSDRHRSGDFQLYFLDSGTGASHAGPLVDGWVEYLHWSPEGTRILLGVAPHGADVSSAEGALSSQPIAAETLTWHPTVHSHEDDVRHQRSAWMYDCTRQQVRRVTAPDINVWEAVWCGEGAIAAITSAGASEGHWYTARLERVALESGERRCLHSPNLQLGWPAASPSGRQLVVAEALCSDRWLVAGDLLLIDTESGALKRIDTDGVDVTYTEWLSNDRLLLAGHRGFETMTAVYNTSEATFRIDWVSCELTTGGRYVKVAGLNAMGDCVLIGENFTKAPEIGVIRGGHYNTIRSLDVGYGAHASDIRSVEQVTWKAPDGLEIQGWLLLPKAKPPHALVMNIHGGPVWHWRPSWLGRAKTLPLLMLVKHRYAIFLPNPRGSGGRGQAFAARVRGDLNGADSLDCLSGIDYLVKQGLADPKRLGITGASYGGCMASWLITQDRRFAAAVPMFPHTNQLTQHLLSNIPEFMSTFLGSCDSNGMVKYLQRSPVAHAHAVRTPTLNICGALDRCTPAEEALQFHRALLHHRVNSVLLMYPREGHGIRSFPAAIDCAARILSWFEAHMPPRGTTES